jgi:hypothetical protein
MSIPSRKSIHRPSLSLELLFTWGAAAARRNGTGTKGAVRRHTVYERQEQREKEAHHREWKGEHQLTLFSADQPTAPAPSARNDRDCSTGNGPLRKRAIAELHARHRAEARGERQTEVQCAARAVPALMPVCAMERRDGRRSVSVQRRR